MPQSEFKKHSVLSNLATQRDEQDLPPGRFSPSRLYRKYQENCTSISALNSLKAQIYGTCIYTAATSRKHAMGCVLATLTNSDYIGNRCNAFLRKGPTAWPQKNEKE